MSNILQIAIEVKGILEKDTALIKRLVKYTLFKAGKYYWHPEIQKILRDEHNVENFITDIVMKIFDDVRHWNKEKYVTLEKFLISVIDSDLEHLSKKKFKMENETVNFIENEDGSQIDISSFDEHLLHAQYKPTDDILNNEESLDYKKMFLEMLYTRIQDDYNLSAFCLFQQEGKKYPDEIMIEMKIKDINVMYNLKRQLLYNAEQVLKEIKNKYKIILVRDI